MYSMLVKHIDPISAILRISQIVIIIRVYEVLPGIPTFESTEKAILQLRTICFLNDFNVYLY